MIRLKNLPALLTASAAFALALPTAAQAYQITGRYQQAEARNAYGAITVEASIISVVRCGSRGENGGTFYIYSYLNRSGFRAIYPGYWGSPIGGRDFGSFREAAYAACSLGLNGSTATQPSMPAQPAQPQYSPYAAGTWTLATNCGYLGNVADYGYWGGTIALTENSNGALSGSIGDKLKSTLLASDTGWGNGLGYSSAQSGSTVTVILNPSGWESVVELRGTLSGNTISGTVHHYDTDSACSFRMDRQMPGNALEDDTHHRAAEQRRG